MLELMRIVTDLLWQVIFIVISLIILAGCLWLLRVVTEWWLSIDYVEKIMRWIKNEQSDSDR
jgi:hypothetical protein